MNKFTHIGPLISNNPPYFEEIGSVRQKYCTIARNKVNKIIKHFPQLEEEFNYFVPIPFYHLEKDEISIFEKYYCLRNQIYKNYMCKKYNIPIEIKGLFYYYQYIGKRIPSFEQYVILLQKRTIIWKKELDIPFQEFYYGL